MWYTIKKEAIEIPIYAKPNAKQSLVVGIKDGRLHVLIHARPQDGEANIELISFLSTLLNIAKKDIALKSGQTSKFKLVSVPLSKSVLALLDKIPCS